MRSRRRTVLSFRNQVAEHRVGYHWVISYEIDKENCIIIWKSSSRAPSRLSLGDILRDQEGELYYYFEIE